MSTGLKRIRKDAAMKYSVCAIAALCACSLFATVEDDGGMLELWPKDHGRFYFVNAQDAVKAEVLAAPVNVISSEFAFDVKLVKGTAPDVRSAADELKKLGAKGAMWIVNDPRLPLSLCACEDGWAILNVAAIAAEPDKLAVRCEKLLFRTFANIHGIGDSQMMPQCVMKTAVGLSGIDELVCREYSPEAIMKISSYMAQAGYRQCRRGSYYDACEEGWAPSPTNDVQKAIWDKVHQMPTKPIKIVPESKRRKEGGK